VAWVLAITASCRLSHPVGAGSRKSLAIPPGARQWRLNQEWLAAVSRESYANGLVALRTFDAFGASEISRMSYHQELFMLPAGTMVAEAGSDDTGAIKVYILDGPQSGKTLWMYPEPAEKLGFPPPQSAGK
jgi:hypothetical protein